MKLIALLLGALAVALTGMNVAAHDDDDERGDESRQSRWVRSQCYFTSHTLDCRGSDRRHGVDTIVVTKGSVIWNATVVDTRDGSLTPHAVIIIDEGKVQRIAPISTVRIRVRGKAQAIDGTGKYVVPGYLDMHVHSMPAVDLQPSFWPLMIANGITGVREMAGSAAVIERARRLNADSAAGRVDAPEILQVPGDLFAAPIPPEVGVALVQQQKALGADFIKFVGGRPDTTFAILAEAKKLGLGVAGHLTPAITSVAAAAAGWRGIEHLGASLGIPLECAGDEAAIRAAQLSGQGAPVVLGPDFITSPLRFRTLDAPFYQRVINTFSADKCAAVTKVLAAHNQTWHVPTLIRLRAMHFSNDAVFRTDPNLKYVDNGRRTTWERLAREFTTDVPASAAATFRDYYPFFQKVVDLLKQNGVPLLAGSDTGGIWIVPGFGLHQEFRELAHAGLTPLEVLQSTTLNGAKFLGREATMGTVDEGKNADLVLLNANPIKSARNLSRISAVFLNGKYFSKHALEDLKRGVARAYADPATPSAEDTTHVH